MVSLPKEFVSQKLGRAFFKDYFKRRAATLTIGNSNGMNKVCSRSGSNMNPMISVVVQRINKHLDTMGMLTDRTLGDLMFQKYH